MPESGVGGVPGGEKTDYWLASVTEASSYGYATKVKFKDGPHGEPQGVADAAALYRRIFRNSGPFVMVSVGPVPDLSPQINEEAADTCRALIDGSRRVVSESVGVPAVSRETVKLALKTFFANTDRGMHPQTAMASALEAARSVDPLVGEVGRRDGLLKRAHAKLAIAVQFEGVEQLRNEIQEALGGDQP